MSDQDTGSENHQPLYRLGVPNVRRVESMPYNMLGLSPAECSRGAAAVARVLDRPVEYVDKQGYERAIIAGAIDAEKEKLTRVEQKAKKLPTKVDVEFRLKACVDNRIVIDWEVETYNPFFGCLVGYLAWHDERVVVIYREKHRTYACTLSLDGAIRREGIDDCWLVAKHHVAYLSDQPQRVERRSIPSLDPLPALSFDQARSEGSLPDGSIERNARRKEIERIQELLRSDPQPR